MKALEPLILLFGAVLIALMSAGITSLYYRHRLRTASKRAWAAAEVFYTRRAHNHVIR